MDACCVRHARMPDESAAAYGEVVWSWRRDPGATSAEVLLPATGARKAASPGRARISCKTIARGKPGCLGCTCQTRVLSFTTKRTRCCGRSRRPAFPAPSAVQRDNEIAKLRRNCAVRMRAYVYPRHCEERSDEAIQLSCCGKAGLLSFARNDGWATSAPKSASPYTASTPSVRRQPESPGH